MNIGDLFAKHPKSMALLNNGVTRVKDASTPEEFKTLRFELQTFVCEGHYAKGLDTILRSYLGSLDKPEQPAVWVSGFFGSGKSMLVKILRHLWVDYVFNDDQAKARGLANLSPEVNDLLKELSTAGKRCGGLQAASGTLGAELGDNARLSLLNIIFRSVGLPPQYPLARFVMWLKENDTYEKVRRHIEKAGRNFDKELLNLHVSTPLAQALIQADDSLPSKPGEVLKLLSNQFPYAPDITIDQMVQAIRQALVVDGKMPCTLVVLDEVQQFIGEDSDRMRQIQEIVEACSKQFQSRLMFVATGQSALSGTSQLQKLRDRFRVTIQLSDADVEAVIRKVILAKKPDKQAAIKKVVSSYEGEITRHLVGTKIEPRTEDDAVYVADYPLLPVRRRFWERVLRAVDQAGTAAQLRNQLTIVYEAVRQHADESVETVVGGDFIYWQKATDLLQTGMLQRDIDELIRKLDNKTPQGRLSARLCATIYLINKLPHDAGADLGIRANTDTLADLLVEDLKAGSTELRRQIPDLLQSLVNSGRLMVVENEYRLQTKESKAWDDEYRKNYTRIFNDAARIADERAEQFRGQLDGLRKLQLLHGGSKVPRKVELFTSADKPVPTGQGVPVWVQDDWSSDEKTVISEAQKAGTDSPMVFVFIPKGSSGLPDDLKKALASLRAAEETLNFKGTPSTDAGREACAAIENVKFVAESKLKSIIQEIMGGARVFMAGGNEVTGMFLQDRVEEAARNALTRLYPQFDIADDPRWEKVVERAKKGDGNALEVLGHKADPNLHPVCSAILAYVATGKRGSDIRKNFAGGDYGWPQDAIDGALILLSLTDHLRVTQNGQPIDARQLDHAKVGVCDFRLEQVTITAQQKMALRKLFQAAQVNCKPGEEAAVAPDFLQRLVTLAEEAGGEAPLPAKPNLTKVQELRALTGNEQLVAIVTAKDELNQNLGTWKKIAGEIQKRQPRWENLSQLAGHAEKLPVHAEVKDQIQAIEDERQLLADPDLVVPLCNKLCQALRQELSGVHQRYQQIHKDGMKALNASDAWPKLKDEQRKSILNQNGLTAVPSVKVGTEAEIIASLDEMSLEVWQARCDALPQRFQNTQREAAKLIEPKVSYLKLPTVTIRKPEEIDPWLESVRAQIEKQLKSGPVAIE